MKKLICAISLTLALCAAPLHAKTLTIGIDLSGSNPMLAHENFAAMAGQYAGNQILQLKEGDKVIVMTFGSRKDAENFLRRPFTISRKLRAKKVAGLIASLFRKLPEQADQGQPSTNIVAWLEFTNGFDCSSEGSTILAFTDALEASSYVSPNDFMNGRKGLPDPDVSLKGCDLVFYGLGAGLEPIHVKNIRKSWKIYAEKSGANFTAIIP